MKRFYIIVLMVLIAYPAFSQVAEPSMSFQSTSTMAPSGSTYSSTPVLNQDGTAFYNGAPSAPPKMNVGAMRKSGAFDDEDEDMPLSDALLPLLLFALGYGLFVLRRTRHNKIHTT